MRFPCPREGFEDTLGIQMSMATAVSWSLFVVQYAYLIFPRSRPQSGRAQASNVEDATGISYSQREGHIPLLVGLALLR
jgi:hypothetical protein